MDLSMILSNLAVESGAVIEEQQASPEEITVVTNATVTELEEVIEQMAEDVEHACSSNDAACKMIDVIESLESKVAMMRGMRDSGTNLNAVSAKQYASGVVVALECRGFPAALYRKDIAELETSFESASRYDYTTEAEEKTQSLAAKIKGMLSKALDSFIQWWKNMMSRVSGLNKSLGELGASLVKRAGRIESGATSTRKVKINGLSTLVKGKDDIDVIAALDTAKAAAKDITVIEGTLATALGQIAKSAVVANGDEAFKKGAIVNVKTKIALYGDQSIEMSEGGNYALSSKKNTVEGEVTPLSGAEIATVGRKLVDLGMTLSIADADQKRMIGTLENSIDAVVKSLGDKETSLSGKMLKEFNRGLSVIRSGRTVLNQYAGQLGKQAYRFAAASANAY